MVYCNFSIIFILSRTYTYTRTSFIIEHKHLTSCIVYYVHCVHDVSSFEQCNYVRARCSDACMHACMHAPVPFTCWKFIYYNPVFEQNTATPSVLSNRLNVGRMRQKLLMLGTIINIQNNVKVIIIADPMFLTLSNNSSMINFQSNITIKHSLQGVWYAVLCINDWDSQRT
jgi:hypothetical protein